MRRSRTTAAGGGGGGGIPIAAKAIALIILLSQTVDVCFAKLQPCEVETGQTNIILDIEESRGSCKLFLFLFLFIIFFLSFCHLVLSVDPLALH